MKKMILGSVSVLALALAVPALGQSISTADQSGTGNPATATQGL